MKRRDFLKRFIGTSCGVGAYLFSNPFQPRFRIARAATGKVLVVIFQRGGCDGLNTVVPYGESLYYSYRPTIAIAPPDVNNVNSAIDLDGFFGLHPGLAAFEPLYQAGDMAILPTVHYPNATRSHFDGQPLIETSAAVPQQGLDGWLNRHLTSHADSGQLRAAAFANGEDSGLPASMRGAAIVSTFSDLTDFNLGLSAGEEADMVQRLDQIYSQTADQTKRYRQLLHDFGGVALNDLNIIAGIDFTGYNPANGASYPDTVFGVQLKQTAQLIKEGVGLEVAALSKHKWDHHRDQGGGESSGKQYNLFVEFAESIAAFYQDLGAQMSDVMVLTMTEFGRSAKENASKGTDHGNASTWFVISKSLNGGIYLGTGWPGLATEQLYNDRFLAHTVDYRDVLGEVISLHLGNNDLATVIPGHSYNPVGFIT